MAWPTYSPDQEQDEDTWGKDNPQLLDAFTSVRESAGKKDQYQEQDMTPVQDDKAEDGQRLEDQTPWTVAAFKTRYGEGAAAAWKKEHNADLLENRKIYGVSEPTPGTHPLAGGTYGAPDRTIGRAPPPGQQAQVPTYEPPTVSAQTTTPGTQVAPTTNVIQQNPDDEVMLRNKFSGATVTAKRRQMGPRSNGALYAIEDGWEVYADMRTAKALPANALGLGNIGSSPAPQDKIVPGTPLPGTKTPLQNADGSQSTERSITVTDPRLNQGRPTNIPSIWNGMIVSPAQAVEFAIQSGVRFQSYDSLQDAEAAAQQRSAELEAGRPSIGGAAFPSRTPAPSSATATPPVSPGTAQGAPTTLTPQQNQATPTGQAAPQTASPSGYTLSKDARQGLYSTPGSPYWVEPDGRLYSADAQGQLRLTGVNPNEYTKGQPITVQPPNSVQSMSSTNPNAGAVVRLSSKTSEDSRPVTVLAELNVQKRRGSADEVANESRAILQGIGKLIRGEPGGEQYEGYLNDIARLAWAKQEKDQGRESDPLQAPLDYIEKWKDAFYGSDPNVPFVKDLDQQMIDAAVTRTPSGQSVFDWKKAYGPSGDQGLISRQVASNDCGPNAFSTILRSRGYNIDPTQAFQYAKKYGYHNGEQFTGPWRYAEMLRKEAGINAQAANIDWTTIDKELAEGRPVTLSSGGHYWVVSSFRDGPNGREYYGGATSAVVGNPEWARKEQIQYGGAPNIMITASGEVDPNSRSVTELGLRPPGPQAPTRANLSLSQNQAQTRNPGVPQNQLGLEQIQKGLQDSGTAQHAGLIAQASTRHGVDPLLLAAMMEQESGGDPETPPSYAGARGLMQLMPDTARELGVQDIDNPSDNVHGGAKYLRQLLDLYDGDLDMALAAYNAGPGAVNKYGGVPPYSQTQAYVRDVKAKYQRMRQNSGQAPAQTVTTQPSYTNSSGETYR